MKFNNYEIPQEEWEKLCSEQKNGYLIVPDAKGYPILKKADIDIKRQYNEEIITLNKWFSDYYTKHEQKYRRLITLNKKCDDGTSPNDKILALYNEAETKRKRIQQLEVMLNE